MNTAELLAEAYGRIPDLVQAAVTGLEPAELAVRLDPAANSVAWLVWHLTRVQDDHVGAVAGREQVWTAAGWRERFDLPFPPGDIGYGHTDEDVARVQVDDPALLTGYHGAVHEQTLEFLRGVTEADLDRVVDDAWDPPVTLGVRLVSVLDDDLQHAGQALFVRGVLRRLRPDR